MSPGVSVRLEGNTDELRAIMARIADLDPALDEIGASQVTEVQVRFERMHGPDGTPWQGLAARTLARRGKGAKTLRDQGNLYDSVTHQVQAGVAVAIGTNRRYARIHQLGGMAGRGRRVSIPARPFLGLSEDGRAEVLAILRDYVGGEA